MNIKNVEILSYTVPLKEPVKAYAAGLMTGFGVVIVKITDENGNVGQGYTTMHSNQELAIARIIKDTFLCHKTTPNRRMNNFRTIILMCKSRVALTNSASIKWRGMECTPCFLMIDLIS